MVGFARIIVNILILAIIISFIFILAKLILLMINILTMVGFTIII